ncbi:unnamed protein product [Spirodela intermedia]|uniref:Uncharacterized protein n=1 Tax=Spirodela intermedia TaxID=51605 RepID=A0A7I8L2K5_SPIIN|nr:unnamed protein product [Spirodela intermedia]
MKFLPFFCLDLALIFCC